MHQLKDELCRLQERKEMEERQKSWVDRLNLGDSNMEFFNRKTKEWALNNSKLCNLDASGNPSYGIQGGKFC